MIPCFVEGRVTPWGNCGLKIAPPLTFFAFYLSGFSALFFLRKCRPRVGGFSFVPTLLMVGGWGGGGSLS